MPLPQPSPGILGLTAYKVPRHPAPMDLVLDGIGGLQSPPDFLRHLDKADPAALVQAYPDTRGLEARLAQDLGIEADRVLVTAGGDDALDRCCRAWLCPGRSILLPVPTFEMIARYASWAGGRIVELPWPGGEWPLDEVIAAADASTTIVAVVSPNNPTGAVIREAQLRRLSAALPHALLMVDLAYVEFADADLSAVVAELPNAVGFRTLSKAWGLAGLRVGYAFGSREAIAWMRVAGNPYPVSGPSLFLARVRLDEGGPAEREAVAAVRAARDGLGATLARLGAEAQGSQANFVFARTPRALWVRDGMAGLGIAVRAWPGHPSLGDAIRVNVPTEPAALARLHAALEAVLAPRGLVGGSAARLPELPADTTLPCWMIVHSREELAQARAAGRVPLAWRDPGLVEAGAARSVASLDELEAL